MCVVGVASLLSVVASEWKLLVEVIEEKEGSSCSTQLLHQQ